MWSGAAAAGTSLKAGDTIGSYVVEAVLGEGATGVVYRAVGAAHEPVAVKVLKGHLRDEVSRRRFEHEARAAREVRNAHVVPILEAGEANGRPFLVFEYVRGSSLRDRIGAHGPLPLDELARLVAQVAEGLRALHDCGLVHRDVKSSNVMLSDDGTALLADLGLAKGHGYTALTLPGQVLGTPEYLAPELIHGARATPASDIYALGCTVFECLVGQTPFASRGHLQVAFGHLEETPPDPCAARATIPHELCLATLWALEKPAERRPPTAIAYREAIDSALGMG